MHLRELEQLVSAGESERLELKRSTAELEAGLRSATAMLNGPVPGFVVFGVADSGEIVGQEIGDGTLERIANICRSRIDPPAFPQIETVALASGAAVIVLHLPGGTGMYTYDGRPYQRVGATTQHMPAAEYERRLIERMHGTVRWENRVAEGFILDDLDQREIVVTVEEAIRRFRLEEPGTREPLQLLMGLGLLSESGDLLNAAVVLFGKPQRMLARFTQCQLRMARFRGTTKDEFIDNRLEVGNAFTLFQKAQRFWLDHLPVAGRVVPDRLERIDEPLYPAEALREALANALCHRDYATAGGAVSVAIYDDRLEIISAGPLPFGQTVETLLGPHASRPWNPLIAQTFYRRGLIEQWGRGTTKIVALTRDAGLVPPEFEADRFDVTVRFRPLRYDAPTRVHVDLSPLQRTILNAVASLRSSSLSQIRGQIGPDVPERTVQDNLRVLRGMGLVELVGQGRYGRWTLKNQRTTET